MKVLLFGGGGQVGTELCARQWPAGYQIVASDRAVRDALAEHVILRTAWVYSAHGHNFVKTMLRLADTHPSLRVVADQYGCPTAAADIAAALASVAEHVLAGKARWGTYHFAGTGPATWHDFAEAMFNLAP